MEEVKGYFKRDAEGKVVFVEDREGTWQVLKSDIPRSMVVGEYIGVDEYKRKLLGNRFQRFYRWFKGLFTYKRINWQPKNLVKNISKRRL